MAASNPPRQIKHISAEEVNKLIIEKASKRAHANAVGNFNRWSSDKPKCIPCLFCFRLINNSSNLQDHLASDNCQRVYPDGVKWNLPDANGQKLTVADLLKKSFDVRFEIFFENWAVRAMLSYLWCLGNANRISWLNEIHDSTGKQRCAVLSNLYDDMVTKVNNAKEGDLKAMRKGDDIAQNIYEAAFESAKRKKITFEGLINKDLIPKISKMDRPLRLESDASFAAKIRDIPLFADFVRRLNNLEPHREVGDGGVGSPGQAAAEAAEQVELFLGGMFVEEPMPSPTPEPEPMLDDITYEEVPDLPPSPEQETRKREAASSESPAKKSNTAFTVDDSDETVVDRPQPPMQPVVYSIDLATEANNLIINFQMSDMCLLAEIPEDQEVRIWKKVLELVTDLWKQLPLHGQVGIHEFQEYIHKNISEFVVHTSLERFGWGCEALGKYIQHMSLEDARKIRFLVRFLLADDGLLSRALKGDKYIQRSRNVLAFLFYLIRIEAGSMQCPDEYTTDERRDNAKGLPCRIFFESDGSFLEEDQLECESGTDQRVTGFMDDIGNFHRLFLNYFYDRQVYMRDVVNFVGFSTNVVVFNPRAINRNPLRSLTFLCELAETPEIADNIMIRVSRAIRNTSTAHVYRDHVDPESGDVVDQSTHLQHHLENHRGTRQNAHTLSLIGILLEDCSKTATAADMLVALRFLTMIDPTSNDAMTAEDWSANIRVWRDRFAGRRADLEHETKFHSWVGLVLFGVFEAVRSELGRYIANSHLTGEAKQDGMEHIGDLILQINDAFVAVFGCGIAELPETCMSRTLQVVLLSIINELYSHELITADGATVKIFFRLIERYKKRSFRDELEEAAETAGTTKDNYSSSNARIFRLLAKILEKSKKEEYIAVERLYYASLFKELFPLFCQYAIPDDMVNPMDVTFYLGVDDFNLDQKTSGLIDEFLAKMLADLGPVGEPPVAELNENGLLDMHVEEGNMFDFLMDGEEASMDVDGIPIEEPVPVLLDTRDSPSMEESEA